MQGRKFDGVIETERLERGSPLLTIETEVNGDSKRTNERGPFLVGSLGLSCRYKRFLFCLVCSSQPLFKICFPSLSTISISFPHRLASWAGMQSY